MGAQDPWLEQVCEGSQKVEQSVPKWLLSHWQEPSLVEQAPWPLQVCCASQKVEQSEP